MTIQMYICLMHAHMREKFFAPVISRTFNLYTRSAFRGTNYMQQLISQSEWMLPYSCACTLLSDAVCQLSGYGERGNDKSGLHYMK